MVEKAWSSKSRNFKISGYLSIKPEKAWNEYGVILPILEGTRDSGINLKRRS